MSHSTNWIAQAIPSIAGSKTTLVISGDVPSGIIAPTLVISSLNLPTIVFGVELKNEVPGSTMTKVSLEHDITGKDELSIVLVFNEGQQVVGAMIIDRTIVG